MTLQQINYALSIAETGSMNKAAAELYISQPAVSQSVKQLENQLGVALFNRTHRGMELSEEGGKRIIDRVERALRLFEEAEKEVCATGENGNEEIRISAPEEVFRYVLAEKAAEPVVVGAEKMELIVEKEVELVHPCLEELGEKEVTSLVEDDQQSQRDDNLNNLY